MELRWFIMLQIVFVVPVPVCLFVTQETMSGVRWSLSQKSDDAINVVSDLWPSLWQHYMKYLTWFWNSRTSVWQILILWWILSKEMLVLGKFCIGCSFNNLVIYWLNEAILVCLIAQIRICASFHDIHKAFLIRTLIRTYIYIFICRIPFWYIGMSVPTGEVNIINLPYEHIALH